jgi:hypothetical protein
VKRATIHDSINQERSASHDTLDMVGGIKSWLSKPKVLLTLTGQKTRMSFPAPVYRWLPS